MKTRLLALVMALLMCLTLLPAAALADAGEIPAEETAAEEEPVLDGAAKPGKPALESIKNTVSGVKITWSKVKNADGYIIFRKTGGGDWERVGKVKSGTKISYIDKTAESGTKYTYTVRAYIGTKKGACDTEGLTILRLDAPAVKSAKSVSGGIKITWNKITGAKKYAIYRKAEGESSWTKIAAVKSAKYTDKTAQSGVTYTYTVRAVGSGGNSAIRAGVSAKYSGAGGWSEIYRDYVMNTNAYDDSSSYLLHDLDGSGTPELVVFPNDYDSDVLFRVYTVQSGTLTFVGSVTGGETTGYYMMRYMLVAAPGSGYNGFSYEGGGGADWMWKLYAAMKDGNLIVDTLVSSMWTVNEAGTGAGYEILEQTGSAKKLRAFYTLNSFNIPVAAESAVEISSFTLEEIRSMGWQTFVDIYLYNREYHAASALSGARLASLQAFLDQFMMYYPSDGSDREYNYKTAADGDSNILDSIMLYSVNCSLYPGEAPEEHWYDTFDFGDHIGAYAVYDAEQIEWIAENIFNLTESDFAKISEKGEREYLFKRVSSGGKTWYYYPLYGVGDPMTSAEITKITEKDGKYYVTYELWFQDYEYRGTYYAVFEYKTIGGSGYWSLYIHNGYGFVTVQG